MVKWQILYSRVAAKHRASSHYVSQIHHGQRKIESSLSREIAATLKHLDNAVRKFEHAVEMI